MILSPSDDFAGTFAAALSEAAPEGSILHLEPGRYLFHRRDAFVLPIPISNANADDGSVSLRHAAICMRGKRNLILDELWDGQGNFVDDNTLSVYIRRLREKIEEQPSRPEHLLTVRGMGYRWEGED